MKFEQLWGKTSARDSRHARISWMISLYDKLPQEGSIRRRGRSFLYALTRSLSAFLSLARSRCYVNSLDGWSARSNLSVDTKRSRTQTLWLQIQKHRYKYRYRFRYKYTTRCENKHSLLHSMNFTKISASSFFQFSLFFGTCTGFCVFLFMINFHNFRLSEFSTKRYSIHTYLTCCGCTRF